MFWKRVFESRHVMGAGATAAGMAAALLFACTPMPAQTPQAAAPAQPGTLAVGTPIHLQLNTGLDTDTSRQGDKFTATVTAPVYDTDGTTVLVPATSIVEGQVASVEKSGKMSGNSQLQLNFQSLRLPNGTSYPMRAEVSQVNTKGGVGKVITGSPSTNAEGGVQQSQGRSTAGKTAAGGVVGTAIGAIAGGGKGAAIGAISGVGLGAIMSGAKGGKLELKPGTELTITLNSPLQLRN